MHAVSHGGSGTMPVIAGNRVEAAVRPLKSRQSKIGRGAVAPSAEEEELAYGPHRRQEQFTMLSPRLAQRIRTAWDEADDVIREHDNDVRAGRIPEMPILPTSPREAWTATPYAHMDELEFDDAEGSRSWSVLSADADDVHERSSEPSLGNLIRVP